MNTSVVKSSKVLKGMMSTVRTHLDAVERARELYLAQIKRAELDYYERIKKATAILTGEEEGTNAASETPAHPPTDGGP
jgi:hypothetical protein